MIITKTPLRVSFLGGNTDIPEYFLKFGGLVLTTTIDKYIYCIVKERFDDLIIVNYSIKETVSNIDHLKHDLVREALKLLKITKGIEISFLADIPTEGTGLGSSSAVTVGVLNALHTFLGENVNSVQLAQEAIQIEVNTLKKPIGLQDQWAVALGDLRWVAFKEDGKMNTGKININESVKEDFNNSLMLVYTGITRKTDDILGSLNVLENQRLLGQGRQFAANGVKALERGDLKSFGDALDGYWTTKKEANPKVTNLGIDDMYHQAVLAGAIGGKIIGAGAGGFLLIMFPANKRAVVKESLKDYQELPFRFSKEGSKVLINI